MESVYPPQVGLVRRGESNPVPNGLQSYAPTALDNISIFDPSLMGDFHTSTVLGDFWTDFGQL